MKNKLLRKAIVITGCLILSINSYAQNWDINTLRSINPQNPHSFIMRGLTSSSYPVGAAVPLVQLVTGYIAKDQKLQRKGWETAGSLAVTVIVAEGLKYAINRQRPYEKYPGVVFPYDASEHGQSFPSGHASIAFATATTLTLEYRKWYVAAPAYLLATAVGYSRLYMGEHYPTDVIGGAAVGAASAVLSHWLTNKLFKFRPPEAVRYIENK